MAQYIEVSDELVNLDHIHCISISEYKREVKGPMCYAIVFRKGNPLVAAHGQDFGEDEKKCREEFKRIKCLLLRDSFF